MSEFHVHAGVVYDSHNSQLRVLSNIIDLKTEYASRLSVDGNLTRAELRQ